MKLTINTNSSSINAQRQLSLTKNTLNTTIQRLSSGLRVNSAKDDAAGLAISERMNTQEKGMDVAIRNANDGISLAQVTEGAMQRLTDILQRCRELAVQSINWTNSPSDRQSLDKERDQLMQEFSRIVSTSNFNGHKLLDGSFSAQTFQVGPNSGDVLSINLPSLRSTELAAATFRLDASVPFYFGNNGRSAGDIVLSGVKIATEQNESSTSIAEKINATNFETKIYAEVNSTKTWIFFGTPSTWPVEVKIKLANGDASNSQTVGFTWNPNDPLSVENAIQNINAVSNQTGIRANKSNQHGYLKLRTS